MSESFKMIAKRLFEAFYASGLEVRREEFIIMSLIQQRKEITQQEISNSLCKDKSVILRQIAHLEQSGLVIRMADKLDKRKKIIKLTPAGKILLEKCKVVEAQFFSSLLSGLTLAEVDNFIKITDKIDKQLYTEQN